MAAAAANRVEVPVLGFVDLLAEAGVGGVQCGGGAGSRNGGWWSKRPAARGKGF